MKGILHLTTKQAQGFRCPRCGSNALGQDQQRGNTLRCLACGCEKALEAFSAPIGERAIEGER